MYRIVLVLCLLTLPLTSCGLPSIKPSKEDQLKVQQYNKVAKKGDKTIDPVHGEEVAFWYGALTGVGETNANGVGFIHAFKDGTSVVTINLNVQPPEKPSYFTALLKNDSLGDTLEIGDLTSIIGDARHSAKLEVKEDLSQSLHVLILKHADEDDPGTLTAEGFLKKPSEMN